MLKGLEARIQKLEAENGIGGVEACRVRIVSYIGAREGCAYPLGELYGFRNDKVGETLREPGESEEALFDRANQKLAPRELGIFHEMRKMDAAPVVENAPPAIQRQARPQRIEDRPAEASKTGNKILGGSGSSWEILKH